MALDLGVVEEGETEIQSEYFFWSLGTEEARHESGWGGHRGTHPGRVSELWPGRVKGQPPELSHAFSHRDKAVPAPRQDLTLSKDEVSKFLVLLYI